MIEVETQKEKHSFKRGGVKTGGKSANIFLLDNIEQRATEIVEQEILKIVTQLHDRRECPCEHLITIEIFLLRPILIFLETNGKYGQKSFEKLSLGGGD